MPQEILKQVAKDIKDITPALNSAKELVKALEEAGEDVGTMKTEMRTLEMRKTKWERMLSNRGVM